MKRVLAFDCAQNMKKMMQMCTRQFSIPPFLHHLSSVIELAHFDTWRRCEFPAAPSGVSVWEARCKEQCWRKAIYNPTTMLPSLPYSTPSAEVLLRDKEVQLIWGGKQKPNFWVQQELLKHFLITSRKPRVSRTTGETNAVPFLTISK